MAYASNPVRNEAEEFIRLKIGRLGPNGLDRGSIVRRFVERGASKTRIHAWIAAAVHDTKNPPADTLKADLAVAKAAIEAAETARCSPNFRQRLLLRRWLPPSRCRHGCRRR